MATIRKIRSMLVGIGLLFAVGHAEARSARDTSSGMSSIVDAIAAGFETHPLVGLGEIHRQRSMLDLYRAVIADPRILCRIDDIAVEFGNSRLQSIADRYVGYRPGTVSLDEKRSIWRDTGQWMVWDSPLYERFFDAVREANLRGTCPKPVRVLLADPPIDWAKVTTAAQYQAYRVRDAFFADLLEREVLNRGRRALVIAGSPHLWKALPADTAEKPTMGQILDRRHPGALLSLVMLPSPEIAANLGMPPAPGILSLKGASAGRQSFAAMVLADEPIEMAVDGKSVNRSMGEVAWPPAERVVDGLLSLDHGPPADPDPATYREPRYQRELRRRGPILQAVHGIDFPGILEATLKAE